MHVGVVIVMTGVSVLFRSLATPLCVHAYLQELLFLNFLVSQNMYACVGVRFSSIDIRLFCCCCSFGSRLERVRGVGLRVLNWCLR